MRVSDYMKYSEDPPAVMYNTTSRRNFLKPTEMEPKPYSGKLAEIKPMNLTGKRQGGTEETQKQFLEEYTKEWTSGEPHLFDRTPFQNHAIR